MSRCHPALLAAACAHYTPLPLPERAKLAAGIEALRHDGPPSARPLTVAAIAALVLQNNPDLRAARRQHGVARAQLLQAGIAPNPVLTGSLLPLAAGNPGTAASPATASAPAVPAGSTTPGYSIGLTYDIRSLLTLNGRRRAARAAALQVDAQLLWQEWQIVGQARLLAVDLAMGQRGLALLARARDVLRTRTRLTQLSVDQGNATYATLAPDLGALSAAETALHDAQRLQLSRRHQLNALLGLVPDAPLPLAADPGLPAVDPASVLRDLASLPQRRPDLAALRYGYQSEDARLRVAIMGQFPNLTFGVVGGSDNNNVRNLGPQVSVELPVFDRNQGNIAIERATRLQLRDEYAARLQAADGQVRAMLSEIGQLRAQLAEARPGLAPVRRMAQAAGRALQAGSLDERSAVDFVTAQLGRESEIVMLEQALLEQEIALGTLTGAGLPALAVTRAANGPDS